MEAGRNALAPARSLLGLTSQEAADAAMANFQQSPAYNWQFIEGMRAIGSAQSARGMLRSGATQKALQQRGQQLANVSFGDYYNRLLGFVQASQNSAVSTGAAWLQTAKDITQTNVSAAGAQASIYGNAVQSVGSAANTDANYSLYRDARWQKPDALTAQGRRFEVVVVPK